MKKVKSFIIFYIIGYLMIIIAVIFLLYAFSHPEGTFPGGKDVAMFFYKMYIAVNISMFVLGRQARKKSVQQG